MDIKVKDVIEICSGRLIFGDKEIVCKDFSKDTRTIKKDDVYVGIKGENFDGNTLYEKAFEQGAKVCILEDSGSENKLQIKYENVKRLYSDRVLVVVEDSIRALQELASYKRDLYDVLHGIFLFSLFMITWIPINIICLFKKELKWVPIEHNKKVKLDALLSEK